MDTKIVANAQGKITAPASMYKPSDKAKTATAMVVRDFERGQLIQSRSRVEFNDRTVLSEVDVNQKAFNSYVPPRSEDPDESWRAQTVRPITRNKLISIAAHVTTTILYPNVFAQNDRDEEDKEAAEVMRDLIEYQIDNSNYSRQFLNAVVTALVDPAVIVEAKYSEVMRQVKEMQDNGKWTVKEILDEVLSGFAINIVPCRELLIANIYESNIQKQRFLIRRKNIDFLEAELIYGKHENFQHVKPGVICVFHPDNSTFYEQNVDELMGYMVQEVVYYNRALDLELTFINGILMCDPEYPNRRRDKMYPFAKSGYEPINNGQFFYYKSAANKLGSDQDIVDTLYNMIIDGTFLTLMPPMALYGSEEINSSVTIPGTITEFRNPDTKLESIAPKIDLRAGMETVQLTERSMSESSQDNMRAGVSSGGSGQTAREVLLLEQNARIALGLFGKMIGFLVEDIGKLMMGDIIQHMTVAEIDSTTDSSKYRSFILSDKISDGRKVSKQIKFIDPSEQPSEGYTHEELESKKYELLEQEGGPRGEKKIALVNPEIFRNMKYKVKVNADELTPKSKALEKALNLEAFDRLVQHPLADQEAVLRDFLLDAYKPGAGDKYIMKDQQRGQMAGSTPQAIQQKGVNQNLVGQLTGGNSLGIAASSEA